MIKVKLVIITLIFLISCSVPSRPYAVDGVLDLRDIDLPSMGVVTLSGEWEFYWQQLLSPADFTPETSPELTAYVKLPDVWKDHFIDNTTLPGRGFATYRLIIKTDYHGRLALGKIHANTAFRLWVNGELLSEAGFVSQNPGLMKPGQITEITDIDPSGEYLEIIIQVSNYSYFLGGLWDPIKFGTIENIHRDHEISIAYSLFLCGGLLIIGLYHIVFFLLRRRDLSSLWIGIASLLLSSRTLVTNDIFFFYFFPGINWELLVMLNFLSFTLLLPVFLSFFYSLYPEYISKRIIAFPAIAGLLYSILVLILPADIYSTFLWIFHLFALTGAVYLIYAVVKAFINKADGALIVLSGLLLFFIVMANDILAALNIINSIQLLSLGLFVFIIILSFNLSRRFAMAFDELEDLSGTLEKKVDDRTSELAEERNRLKKFNDKIIFELSLAKKIQQKLIPQEDPEEYICSLYKPMEEVGGDFFDFITFRSEKNESENSIGIFLSDVSGHGVPAALITSMIKSGILQSGKRTEDPAELLNYLNNMLITQTGDNFVTVFYCIYTPGEGRLLYASAGHNPPYIIESGRVLQLGGHRSIPLAIMNNKQLVRAGKEYKNSSTVLKSGSRLILYTDGLTEAASLSEPHRLFEDNGLNDLFLKLRDRTNREFISGIYSELKSFRQTDYFDDDICVICVDII